MVIFFGPDFLSLLLKKASHLRGIIKCHFSKYLIIWEILIRRCDTIVHSSTSTQSQFCHWESGEKNGVSAQGQKNKKKSGNCLWGMRHVAEVNSNLIKKNRKIQKNSVE